METNVYKNHGLFALVSIYQELLDILSPSRIINYPTLLPTLH